MSIYWLPVCCLDDVLYHIFSWIAYQRMAVFHHPPIPYHQSLSFYLLKKIFTYIFQLKFPSTSFPAEVLQLILGRKNFDTESWSNFTVLTKMFRHEPDLFLLKRKLIGSLTKRQWQKEHDWPSKDFLGQQFPLFAFLQKVMNQYSCNFLRWMKINFDVLTDLFLFLLRALFT